MSKRISVSALVTPSMTIGQSIGQREYMKVGRTGLPGLKYWPSRPTLPVSSRSMRSRGSWVLRFWFIATLPGSWGGVFEFWATSGSVARSARKAVTRRRGDAERCVFLRDSATPREKLSGHKFMGAPPGGRVAPLVVWRFRSGGEPHLFV